MDSISREDKKNEPWTPPLKVPVTEVIDLSSNSEEPVLDLNLQQDLETRDALGEDGDVSDDQWSIYEDILNNDKSSDDYSLKQGNVSQFRLICFANCPDLEACTPEESIAFRKRLRLVGEHRFIQETVEAGTTTAKKLLTAFGVRPPFFLEGEPDSAYYTLLGLGICRELSKREKLPQYNTIDDAVQLLKRSCKIIVLTGAGVSAT